MTDHGRRGRRLAADLGQHIDTQVRVCGWVDRDDHRADRRGVVLRDHTGSVPLTTAGAARPSPADLTPESAIEVVGTVRPAGDGGVELDVDELQVASVAPPDLPITGSSPLAQRLDWRYLDLRRPRNRLIFEIQTTAEQAMRALWRDQGFLEVHSPKLRATPNKSGDQLFSVDYFGQRAYLAQSPQFHKQMAMSAGFDRVFEIGPVFRAQAVPTSRHDTEFTSVDVEISWVDSDAEVIDHAEQLLATVLAAVRDDHGEAIRRHFDTTVTVPAIPFPRVTLAHAKRIVAAAGGDVGDVGDVDDDLDPGGERLLADHVAGRYGHQFVCITDYPQAARPFFHMRRTDGSDVSRSFDVLLNGLEIISGAQREHRHDRLVDYARGRGLPLDGLHGFLDLFRYGCPPHGGFGLGLTRLLVALLGLEDVREATYLFRGPDRLTP